MVTTDAAISSTCSSYLPACLTDYCQCWFVLDCSPASHLLDQAASPPVSPVVGAEAEHFKMPLKVRTQRQSQPPVKTQVSARGVQRL